MRPRVLLLVIQIMLFLVLTTLGVATDYLTNDDVPASPMLELLRRASFPVAAVLLVVVISLMVWQHKTDEDLLAAQPHWDSERPPFPGLEAFTEDDAGVFFGREAEIAGLLERLHPVLETRERRIVVVVGPSGVGKSSLVFAGLLPSLRQRRAGWILMPPIVPGDRPVKNLARSLAMMSPEHSAGGILARLSEGKLSSLLPDSIRRDRYGRVPPMLLVVDQAEELVTLTGSREREEFLSLLDIMLTDHPRRWVVLVMRSEFLTAFLETEYAHLFREPVAIGALGRNALIEVIERPAERAGLRFGPSTLPKTIADDAGSGQALPLLAYTLQELYMGAGRGGTLTIAAYHGLGGVSGILGRQADKVTAELYAANPESPVMATLLKFVTIGENEPTRRRIERGTLCAAELRVADAFIAARLLTSGDADSGTEDAVLEVSHEALFRDWAPLRQEIEAHADALRWRADLERWALDWERSGRQDSYLLRGERLKAAQQWSSADSDLLPSDLPLVAEFLDSSRRADQSTMERLSETISRQALAHLDRDPEHSLRLALTAFEECKPTALARHALTAALLATRVRAIAHGHENALWGVAWSPDGQRIATASDDHTARIWNAADGTELIVLRGHDHLVDWVSWSPDGHRVATSSYDRTARIWDATDGAELLVFRGHHGGVREVAWSPDGHLVATASEDQTARIWDATDGAELLVLRGHDGWVRGVAWSPDGRCVTTASDDRTARVWDAATGTERLVLLSHEDAVRGVAWSPDGQRIATASEDHSVRIWNAADGAELIVLHGHATVVRGVAWSPDCRRIATASDDRTARIWDVSDRTELMILHGHQNAVRAVEWSLDGGQIATASDDCTVRIWNAADRTESMTLLGHRNAVWDVAWSPDNRRLATASEDRTARIWDAAACLETVVMRGHENAVRGVAWSPDGSRIATASEDRTARVWDAAAGRELIVLHGSDGWFRSIAWSPDGTRILTASDDRTARIWNATDGRQITVLRGHENGVWDIAWSPDSRLVVTASEDRTVRIWDARDGMHTAILRGHENAVRGVAWSPNSRRIATVAEDCTARIWNAEDGDEIVVVGVHRERADAVTWSPDSRRIATSSHDNTVHIWEAVDGIEVLLNKAKSRVLGKLSDTERARLVLPRTARRQAPQNAGSLRQSALMERR
jgi:WD40 repeat protein